MPTESEKEDSNGSENGGGGAVDTKSVLITAGVAIAVFVIAVGLPLWSGKNLEIKLDYALTAAVAAAICLLLTGQINKLVLGKEGVTIEIKKAILRSAKAPIKEQVVEVPVTRIEEAEKMGVGQIDLLISRRIKALDFVVGSERYKSQAVRTYLEKLSDFDDFRFVILLKSDRTFLGMTWWRDGAIGAFFMGFLHGAYCLGCCWLLMAILFAVGVMNLTWITALSVLVLLEKVIPRGLLVARIAGVVLMGCGGWLALRGGA